MALSLHRVPLVARRDIGVISAASIGGVQQAGRLIFDSVDSSCATVYPPLQSS